MKNGEFLIPITKFNFNLLMHLKLNECNANDGNKRKYLTIYHLHLANIQVLKIQI